MSSYYKNLPTNRVKGYVVKIFDTVNLDIDLELNGDLSNCYRHVKQSEYECLTELNNNDSTAFRFKNNLESLQTGQPTEIVRLRRRMYKCHLKGLSYCKIDRAMKAKEILFIQNFLDRTGYWINVDLSDIDSYGRILVVISNNLNQELNRELLNISINLSVYKLRKQPKLSSYLGKYDPYTLSHEPEGEMVD